MSMIAAKPSGFFRRPGDEGKLQRFLRYGAPTAPEPPAAIELWEAFPGEAAGEVIISIGALPDPLDATAYNDNLGVITDIGWSYFLPGSDEGADDEDGGTNDPVEGSATLSATTVGQYTVTIPEEAHFFDVEIGLWAIGTAGAGAKTFRTVEVPGGEGFGDVIPDSGITPDTGVIPPE